MKQQLQVIQKQMLELMLYLTDTKTNIKPGTIFMEVTDKVQHDLNAIKLNVDKAFEEVPIYSGQ